MDSIDKMQEEGIPPREVSWIEEGEEDPEDALDPMWIGKEEL